LNDKEIIYQIQRIKEEGQVIVRDTFRIEKVPYPVDVPYEVNKLTGFQHFQIWCGRILLAAALIFLAVIAIRKKLI